MSTIINRLRWLSAGVTLTLLFIGWVNSDSEDNKEKSDPYNFNNYKHNYQKETTNA